MRSTFICALYTILSASDSIRSIIASSRAASSGPLATFPPASRSCASPLLVAGLMVCHREILPNRCSSRLQFGSAFQVQYRLRVTLTAEIKITEKILGVEEPIV